MSGQHASGDEALDNTAIDTESALDEQLIETISKRVSWLVSSNYLSSVSHLDRKYTDTIVLHIDSDVVTLDFEMDVSATNRWPVTEDFFFLHQNL